VAALTVAPGSRSAPSGTVRRSRSILCSRTLRLTATTIAVLALVNAVFVVAQSSRPTQPQVEAAYLFNFGKFVTWPADRAQTDSFAICILGKDPFGSVLDATVAGESIGNKKIVVQRLARIQEASGCNILFISSSEDGRLNSILAAAEKMSLLTVSDTKHFAARGGTIGLITQQDKIRFEVNRTAAEHCHLTVSSELLKVAVRVIEVPAPKD
jgi:hypothetical protein